MTAGSPLLRRTLLRRSKAGKEDPGRLNERMGVYEKTRPDGPLVWFHAASVGEAQSTLILIKALQEQTGFQNILVTTGTVTSARLMEKRLPPGAFHQFYPMDHPQWVRQFLDHWQPDLVLWMESELWPNMLREIGKRNIPSALINARMSEKSFRRWKVARNNVKHILDTFHLILTQTQEDADSFSKLGATQVSVSGNLKYSATPLPCDEETLSNLRQATADRPLWFYASTHDGEEEIACRLHAHLKKTMPDLLTIIAPRHPERRDDITAICKKYSLKAHLRSTGGTPQKNDDIYIADTLGEMGLFYRLSPVVCIGRSFSNDGGGGHNPIEAAQLECAILHGPHVQNLSAIYSEMDKAGATLCLKDEKDFQSRLSRLLTDIEGASALQNKASGFVSGKNNILNLVMSSITLLIEKTPQKGSKVSCG